MPEELTLDREGHSPICPASFAEIQAALDQIDPNTQSFVILSQSDGSYLQTAGSRLRLTLEYRQVIADSAFKHYVLGHQPISEKIEHIQCHVGPIQVRKHEVLTLRDAVDVFRSYFESRTIPRDYLLRDVTAMFKEIPPPPVANSL